MRQFVGLAPTHMFVQTLLVLEAADRHAEERGQGSSGACPFPLSTDQKSIAPTWDAAACQLKRRSGSLQRLRRKPLLIIAESLHASVLLQWQMYMSSSSWT